MFTEKQVEKCKEEVFFFWFNIKFEWKYVALLKYCKMGLEYCVMLSPVSNTQ